MSRNRHARTPRWLRGVGKRDFRGTDADFGRASLIATAPVLAAAPVPFAQGLEAAYPAIRREAASTPGVWALQTESGL